MSALKVENLNFKTFDIFPIKISAEETLVFSDLQPTRKQNIIKY